MTAYLGKIAADMHDRLTEEEKKDPTILDKWADITPTVAGEVVKAGVTLKTGSHDLGRVAGEATKAATSAAMDNEPEFRHQAAHVTRHVTHNLAGGDAVAVGSILAPFALLAFGGFKLLQGLGVIEHNPSPTRSDPPSNDGGSQNNNG